MSRAARAISLVATEVSMEGLRAGILASRWRWWLMAAVAAVAAERTWVATTAATCGPSNSMVAGTSKRSASANTSAS